MKTKTKCAVIFLLLIIGCKKETKNDLSSDVQQDVNLTLEDAQLYIEQSKESSDVIGILQLNWARAINRNSNLGNIWHVPLKGQPIFQNYRQGYRELTILRDRDTQVIEARILEIIPDAIYLQKNLEQKTSNFTGRIFEYDLNYNLVKGKLFAEGRAIGDIKILTEAEKLENANKALGDLNPLTGVQGKSMAMMAVQSCKWLQSSYLNSEGEFTIVAERLCTYSFYGDDGGNFYSGIASGESSGSAGGVSIPNLPEVPPPPPSNLPGEDNDAVDPKKMMDCFAQITDPNAACVVRVYVIEPMPGTSFNVGPNSFGHVAISLSKTSGNTTITQTIGFYPTGYGIEKLNSKSEILDNGDIEYNISSTYYVSGESFSKTINYLCNPPKNYHFTDFNCAAYVYGAGQAGSIPIPDPTVQIGISGPGGAGYAKTPAGMATALRNQKSNNPKADVSEAGGRALASKGPCN